MKYMMPRGDRNEEENIWKTIDDVNATFDSLSLINRGRPTKSGLKLSCLTPPNFPKTTESLNVNCEDDTNCEQSSNDSINGFADEGISNSFTLGRGTYLKELTKHYYQAEKDAALQEEIKKAFNFNFSNDAIEKKWGSSEEPVVRGQFDDAEVSSNALTDIDTNTRSIPSYLFEDTVEVRSCSPPFVADIGALPSDRSSSASSEQSGIAISKYLCDTTSTSLETIASDCDNKSDKPNLLSTDISTIAEYKPVVRQRKCRNALLNSLSKMENKKTAQVAENNAPILLKTPNDYLVSSHSNFHLAGASNYHYFKEDNNSDTFQYCEEDFPSLI